MPPRLLVLGAGPAQLGLLRAARRRGLEIVACDRDPAAPGFAYADRRAIVSTEDEDGVARLARAYHVDGVISPGADWPVAIAARVAGRLGLPHPLSPEVAILTVSKLRQRARFTEVGVTIPRFGRAASIEQAQQLAEQFGYPLVVKAPDRQGQRGLGLVEREEGLAAAVAAAIEASRGKLCLVEELVPGAELTVNAFVLDGVVHSLTVTDRSTAPPPAFGVALAHVWPAAPAPEIVEKIAAVAATAALALGVEQGPVYTQLVLGPDGPVLIELAARLGGGHDAELCELALGVDLNGLALDAALGVLSTPPEPVPRVGGACVRFLVPPEGELREVRGLETAQASPGVADMRIYRSPGHRFGRLRTGADRAGAVLAVGASASAAVAAANRAASVVEFVVG